ncbi:MAG: hypothetical protein AAGC57_03390 [Pseudomonadota bacterium]
MADCSDLTVIDAERTALERELHAIRAEAEVEGAVDDDEQAVIDEINDAITEVRRRRADNTRARDAAAEEKEGGFVSGLMDSVGEVIEGTADAVRDIAGIAQKRDTGRTATAVADGALARWGRSISASAGKGGKNAKADAETVQSLLNTTGAGLVVDGFIGPKTIGAILAFQSSQSRPDSCRIDPGDACWGLLTGGGAAAPAEVGTGGWVSDTVAGIGDAVGHVAGAVKDVFGDDAADDEAIEALEALAEEFAQLEREAYAL